LRNAFLLTNSKALFFQLIGQGSTNIQAVRLTRAFQASNVSHIFMASRPDRKAIYLVRFFFSGIS